MIHGHLNGQVKGKEQTKGPACTFTLTGLVFQCPSGWRIQESAHPLYDSGSQEVVITNVPFEPGVSKNTFSGPGKATIAVLTLPKFYRSLSEWIYANRKGADPAVETRIKVRNATVGDVDVVYFASPDTQRLASVTYFLEIAGKPVLVDLSYRAQDPNAKRYLDVAQQFIGTISPAR